MTTRHEEIERLSREVFGAIVRDNELLARTLNTFSFLEHVGSRKILASGVVMTETVLRHATEETRHALFFKRAIRYAGAASRHTSYDSMLIPSAAYGYFQRLDATVRRALRTSGISDHRQAAYLLVTYLIETRAEQLYPLLDELLRHAGRKLSLRSVIAEEDRHLAEMKQGLAELAISSELLEELLEQEASLYLRLLGALQTEATSTLQSDARVLASDAVSL